MAYYTDEKGKLVPYSGEIPQEAIMAIEAADEQTIVERLTRIDAQSIFAYSYPVKTKEGIKDIIGIGVDGAKEIANLLGNIKVSPDIKAEERGDYIYAIVPVTNLVRNVTLLGAAGQPKYIVGEGMELTDRIDATAFVKAISKAQRNGILSVASQETIAVIISKLDTKAIKKLPAPPSYGKALPKAKAPATAKPGAPATGADEEKLKNLRKQIAIEWQKTGKTTDDRKEWQKTEYGVETMSELSEKQLNEMLTKVKALQPSFSNLGFSSETEQKQMRHDFFKLLAEAGYDTDEKKREYLKEKSIVHTAALSRDNLVKLIQEVSKQKGVLEEAESIPEES